MLHEGRKDMKTEKNTHLTVHRYPYLGPNVIRKNKPNKSNGNDFFDAN